MINLSCALLAVGAVQIFSGTSVAERDYFRLASEKLDGLRSRDRGGKQEQYESLNNGLRQLRNELKITQLMGA